MTSSLDRRPTDIVRGSFVRRMLVRRAGHTLLEVLIALALLAILIGIIASLMSVFGRAEQTAQRRAVELRTLRTVRRQLTDDLQRLMPLESAATPATGSPIDSSSDAPGVLMNDDAATNDDAAEGFAATDDSSTFDDSTTNRDAFGDGASRSSISSTGSTFVGTPFAFRCRIHLDDDPGAWLESLLMPVELQGSDRSSPAASSVSDLTLGSQEPMTNSARTPAIEADLEYRLLPDPESTGMGQNLRRSLTRRTPPSIAPLTTGGRDPNAVLDVADLYRVDPEADDAASLLNRMAGTRGSSQEATSIVNAQFRYSDGVDWYLSWNGASRGGAPRAIEMTFDLISPEAVAARRAQGLEGSISASDEFATNELSSDAQMNEAETFDPFELSTAEEEVSLPDTSATIRDTEVRWVFLISDNAAVARPEGESARDNRANGGSR